jgi:hypothetical protein
LLVLLVLAVGIHPAVVICQTAAAITHLDII